MIQKLVGLMQPMRSALISLSKINAIFWISKLSPNTILNMHSLVDERSAKSGEMVFALLPKPNYYFLVHLQRSLKFAC